VRIHRILAHPEVSDEPEEDIIPPQALGTASSATPETTNAQEEGISAGRHTNSTTI